MTTFQRRILLNDIDAAGVAFSARIIAIAHEAFEMACAASGIALETLIAARVGLPLVHVEADFHAPMRHGEIIDIDVACARIGGGSVTIAIGMRCGGKATASVRQIHACVDMDQLVSRPLPDELRAVFATWGPPPINPAEKPAKHPGQAPT
jgi:acyl-CoA thioesterase FadM